MKRSIALLLIFCANVWAAVPNEITYNGRLREYGLPVNGKRTIRFDVYKSEANGASIWSKTFADVTVSSGVFSCILTPEIDWRDKDYWIETIISGKVLSPREKITAQVFALHSQTAENIETAAGNAIHFSVGASTHAVITSAGNIGIGTTNPGANKLEVNGNAKITGDLTVTGSFNLIPAGTIFAFGGASVPAGWLLCDGSLYTTSQYQNLFAAIGYAFGGSGTSFRVPDLRGMFLRGVSGSASNDPDRDSRTALYAGGNTGNNVGSFQTEEFKSHIHDIDAGTTLTVGGNSFGTIHGDYTSARDRVVVQNADYGMKYTGGSETRPKNVYVNYIIKY